MKIKMKVKIKIKIKITVKIKKEENRRGEEWAINITVDEVW